MKVDYDSNVYVVDSKDFSMHNEPGYWLRNNDNDRSSVFFVLKTDCKEYKENVDCSYHMHPSINCDLHGYK